MHRLAITQILVVDFFFFFQNFEVLIIAVATGSSEMGKFHAVP